MRKGARSPFGVLRERYAKEFGVSPEGHTKRIKPLIHQLEMCADDDARRLLVKYLPPPVRKRLQSIGRPKKMKLLPVVRVAPAEDLDGTRIVELVFRRRA